eukprot:CAMPEP_0178627940 /NCGR_PEP_ID=MMETSP0698-20121128/9168_1 /TAXON_ID=265572 /ORGANISM="Extubocellulus spinifer, Strain CCMP396" /LENGTH=221 /DNA_ID=CAMNT_0020267181 /DNA_START=49 /DNA_END=714 /DNA_ORIENTATION=-
MTAIEELLGPKLLTKVGGPAVPTSSALETADVVLLYFSASWCPPCRAFTPLLVDFFEKNNEEKNGVQVVFVSSDSDLQSFEGYYKKMPWLSLPFDDEGSKIKNKLSQLFHIRGIPSLVVIDARTGKYITDNARTEVMSAGSDDSKRTEIVQYWKSKEAVPVEDAVFTNSRPTGLAGIITLLLQNPIYLFVVLYFARRIVSMLAELVRDEKQGGAGVAGGEL